MKKSKKIALAILLVTTLIHNASYAELKFSVETARDTFTGALLGAAAGFTLFKTLEILDKWYISSKKLEGVYLSSSTDLPEQLKADFDCMKNQPSSHFYFLNKPCFQHQHCSFVHKLKNVGSFRFENPRGPKVITYQKPTITYRRSYNRICKSFVVGGAIVGAYVLGNIVQK